MVKASGTAELVREWSGARGSVALLVLLAGPTGARRVAGRLLLARDGRRLGRLGGPAVLRGGVQRRGGVGQVLLPLRRVEALDRELRPGAGGAGRRRSSSRLR